MDKIALIPSFEPDERLIKLVIELYNNEYKIIIVNDGSNSKYNKIFETCSLFSKVISYEKNYGKGYALKTGLKYIKDNFVEYVVITLDSDGQHTVKDANKLYEYIVNNKYDLVLGKRIRSSNTPIRSRLGNTITRDIFYLATKCKIFDTQTGLRAFTNNLIDYMINIRGNRFEYEMNVLLYAKRNNIAIKEIKIETIYIENNKGSHFKTIRDSYKIYKEIFKYILSPKKGV